jgi:beta-1,4-N-acetylglucosaminyltransferase
MIFVTVGSTQFDSLIKKVDDLKAANAFNCDVLCQIGSGTYQPNNCQYFRYDKSIESYIKSSDIVITHGGSTVLQLIQLNKKMIVIPNTALADNHQVKFLTHLSKYTNILWSDDVNELANLYIKSASYEYQTWTFPNINTHIESILSG